MLSSLPDVEQLTPGGKLVNFSAIQLLPDLPFHLLSPQKEVFSWPVLIHSFLLNGLGLLAIGLTCCVPSNFFISQLAIAIPFYYRIWVSAWERGPPFKFGFCNLSSSFFTRFLFNPLIILLLINNALY